MVDVYSVLKTTRKKTYKGKSYEYTVHTVTAPAEIEIQEKGRVLWVKANPRILRNLAQHPISDHPVYIAVFLPPDSLREKDGFLRGNPELLQKLADSFGDLASIETVEYSSSDKVEEEGEQQQQQLGLLLCDEPVAFEAECPFCHREIGVVHRGVAGEPPLEPGECICGAHLNALEFGDLDDLREQMMDRNFIEEKFNGKEWWWRKGEAQLCWVKIKIKLDEEEKREEWEPESWLLFTKGL
jgi:hypothetical protein